MFIILSKYKKNYSVKYFKGLNSNFEFQKTLDIYLYVNNQKLKFLFLYLVFEFIKKEIL